MQHLRLGGPFWDSSPYCQPPLNGGNTVSTGAGHLRDTLSSKKISLSSCSVYMNCCYSPDVENRTYISLSARYSRPHMILIFFGPNILALSIHLSFQDVNPPSSGHQNTINRSFLKILHIVTLLIMLCISSQ